MHYAIVLDAIKDGRALTLTLIRRTVTSKLISPLRLIAPTEQCSCSSTTLPEQLFSSLYGAIPQPSLRRIARSNASSDSVQSLYIIG